MNTINAIFIETGKNFCHIQIIIIGDKQAEEISAVLGGNFITSSYLKLVKVLSLHIFINDMAIPLGLSRKSPFSRT